MSHPVDPSFGRHGNYSTGRTAVEAFRQGSFTTPTNMYHGTERQQPINFWQKVTMRADSVRDALGDKCCRCLHHMPSLVLIVGILLMIGLAIAAVPVAFVLISNAGQASELRAGSDAHGDLPTGSGAVFHSIRHGFDWPDAYDEEDDGVSSKHEKDAVMRALSTKALFPPNVSLCNGFGFACASQPSVVISTTARCDGKPDCADGSDELECLECQTPFWCELSASAVSSSSTKRSSSEEMPRPRRCLRAEHLCNGLRECANGVDESPAFCSRSDAVCPAETRRCAGTPLCLPEEKICDGEQDCRAGDDEANCPTCNRGAKMCKVTKQCVPRSQLCNGIPNCPDGSDEMDCECKACSGSDRALCSNGRCLERFRVCDGTIDCEGGLDEQDCPGTCRASSSTTMTSSAVNASSMAAKTILCDDARHYPESEACSGRVRACARSCATCDARQAFRCNDGVCIRKMEVCDGERDCAGGEDEQGCEDACRGANFKCISSGKCVAQSARCDGVKDCEDGSDEAICDKCSSPGALFCAADARCYPAHARCDGVADCADGSDEAGCTCQECTASHTDTYSCEASKECFKRDTVCNPYSRCKKATAADKLFCAAKSLQGQGRII